MRRLSKGLRCWHSLQNVALIRESSLGVPALGKQIKTIAMNFYRFAGGKIVEERELPDLFRMMVQIGAIKPPSASVKLERGVMNSLRTPCSIAILLNQNLHICI